MLFSSMIFLWGFLPLTVLGGCALRGRAANLFLLGASLVFYAWGEPVYVILMLGSIVFNWGCGLAMERWAGAKKTILILGITVNLGLLGWFKYLGFLLSLFRFEAVPQITLPVGISFFTFQAMSYVIDLYRGQCRVQRRLTDLALYVSFFPQLIAGPIVRYRDIDAQIRSRTVSAEGFAMGLRRFLYGLGKKVILANGMAELADLVFGLPVNNVSTAVAWLGAAAYTMQIYYDFSGYSDMAIGLGRIFGFTFLENFRLPYLSVTIREFWQRWHISLGTWFREYVYFPLGGSRGSGLRTCRNLMIVFLLTGLWHGAGWTFIAWGVYHGCFQLLERAGLRGVLERHRWLGHIYCVLVFTVGWVLFRADDLGTAARYIAHMFLPMQYADLPSYAIQTVISPRTLLIFAAAILGCGPIQLGLARLPKTRVLEETLNKSSAAEQQIFCRLNHRFLDWLELGYLALVGAAAVVLLVSGSYNPFIYFRF